MKKNILLAFSVCIIFLVTIVTIPVSADPSLTVGEITFVKDIPNNNVTFTVPYTAVDVHEIIVSAIKGTSNSSSATVASNLVYIDQHSTAFGFSSFTFSVPYDEFSWEIPYCWIKVAASSDSISASLSGLEIYIDPLQPQIDAGTNFTVIANSDCKDRVYTLASNQNMTVENFSVKNATVNTNGGYIIMDGTRISGKVIFDENGRILADANQVLTLRKSNSIGFVKKLFVEEEQTTQNFTLNNGSKNALVAFDVGALSGNTLFGITVFNVPNEVTVTLVD